MRIVLIILGILIGGIGAGLPDSKPTPVVPVANKQLPDICQLKGMVFIEPIANFATYQVYVEDVEAFADFNVYLETTPAFITRPGHWCYTDVQAFGDFSVGFVDNRALADFAIYYTEYRSLSGCSQTR